MSASATPAPPGATPVGAIVALSLAALASAVSMRLADALLPRLADEFAITLGQASWVITVFAVAYGLSQALFGPLGDRFGKLRVITWACVASAGAALLCGLAPGHHSLLAARLLAGATSAAVIPLAMAWIGDSVPYERRQPVLARFLIGQITGFATGVWAGGYTAEHLPWRTPFFGVAGLFLLAAAVLVLARQRLPAPVLQPPGRPGGAAITMVRQFRAVLAQPWARVVLLVVFCEGAVVYGPFAFIAAHLHQRFGLPLSTVGGLVMGYALGGLVFALGAQVMVARLGEAWLVRAGSWLMAGALAAIAFAPAWGWAVPACMVMGLGFYMLHNTLQTNATQMAPERRGTAVAAFACCFFLGQSVGVGVAGLVVDRAGTSWVLAAGALGLLVVAAAFNRQRARRVVQAAATAA
jgi:predicted MFS family arabinose efflux permease